MKRCMLLGLACLIGGAYLEGTGSESSKSGDAKDEGISYRGVLVDAQEKSAVVDHITISGQDTKIALYAKPQQRDRDPGINTTLLDLKDVQQIAPKLIQGEPEIAEFRKIGYSDDRSDSKRKPLYDSYITLLVTFRDKKTEEYIVQTSRRVFCRVAHGRGSAEKQAAFAAIRSLTIQHGDRNEDCAAAKELLATLDVDKDVITNTESKGKLQRLIDKLSQWIFRWCD